MVGDPREIARLNDFFRQTLLGGKVVMTQGVASLPEAMKANVFDAVRTFTPFTEDNDPYNEHDFGLFEVEGTSFFFKIDYYDNALESGSDNPADPEVTTRVLTIMLASEY